MKGARNGCPTRKLFYRMQPLSAAETDTLFTEVFAGSMSEPSLRPFSPP